MSEPNNNVRDRILDAAVSVLESSGIKKFAQPHIARIAGIPQGHLTYYFPKRRDLLSAAAGRFVGLLLSDIPETLRKEAQGKAQEARAYAVGMAARVVKNRARMRMLLSLVVASEEDPKLARDVADMVDVIRKLLERVLGKDADPVDVELALATLWGIGLLHLVLEDARPDAETDKVLKRLELRLGQLRAAKTRSAKAKEAAASAGKTAPREKPARAPKP